MPVILSDHHELHVLFRQRGSACAADTVLHAGYLQDRYPNFCLHFLRAMYLGTLSMQSHAGKVPYLP
jgi:hypothetical protein